MFRIRDVSSEDPYHWIFKDPDPALFFTGLLGQLKYFFSTFFLLHIKSTTKNLKQSLLSLRPRNIHITW